MAEALATLSPGRGLVESIHEMLLDRILNGTLQPNQTLLERPLAFELGVSRTPLREALRQLEGERLIGRRNDGSLYVRAVTLQEFLEVLHIRSLLEADATGRAAGRLPPRQLADLRKRLLALQATDHPDIEKHRRLDDDLHDMIAAVGGGDLMRGIIADLRRQDTDVLHATHARAVRAGLRRTYGDHRRARLGEQRSSRRGVARPFRQYSGKHH